MSEDALTEALLEAARDLDQRSIEDVLALIHREDRRAAEAVGEVLPSVAAAVELLVDVLLRGGRWFNVGAGTSGRLGALDAAEIPPTFGFDPERVQAVIAGGPKALLGPVEQAEDDDEAARIELRARGLCRDDAVVAISASGRTPFVLGALAEARAAGSRSVAITCDPRSPAAQRAEVSIAPIVGPEVLAGSTRMKGGLAQKLVLHMLSTTVMVRLGRVEGNLMTNVLPLSSKLRRRAERIVMALTGVDAARARRLLEQHCGNLGAALRSARERR
jgi:N-acetylmuramic acid 6-phosphate etherase